MNYPVDIPGLETGGRRMKATVEQGVFFYVPEAGQFPVELVDVPASRFVPAVRNVFLMKAVMDRKERLFPLLQKFCVSGIGQKGGVELHMDIIHFDPQSTKLIFRRREALPACEGIFCTENLDTGFCVYRVIDDERIFLN